MKTYVALCLTATAAFICGCSNVLEGGYYEVMHDGKLAFNTACGELLQLSVTNDSIGILVESDLHGLAPAFRNTLEEYHLHNDGKYSFTKNTCSIKTGEK